MREHLHDAAQSHLGRPPFDEAGAGDRAGVDHRIARAAGDGIEPDGVEGVARRLDADLCQHLRASVVFEREAIDEGLRDRLDGELLPRVADFVNAAVGRDDADAEPVRIGLAQLGNVGGDFAVVDLGNIRGAALRAGRGWVMRTVSVRKSLRALGMFGPAAVRRLQDGARKTSAKDFPIVKPSAFQKSVIPRDARIRISILSPIPMKTSTA